MKSVSLGQNQCVGRVVLPLEALEKNPFFSSCSQHPLACDHIILIFKAGVFKSIFALFSHYLFVCVSV